MKILTTTIGRLFYAVPFAVFGINHFRYAQGMQALVPSYLPFKLFFVYLTGACLIAAALSISTKIFGRLAALMLALMLAIFVVTIHVPGLFQAHSSQMALAGLLKDTSLAGAALFIAGAIKRV